MPVPKDPVKLQEYREKMRSIALSRGYGKWMSGRIRSDEVREKQSKSLKQSCNTPEAKERLSKQAKELGYGKWMTGKKHSEERCEKTGKFFRGKTYEELYGSRAEEEKKRRRDSNKARFPNGPTVGHCDAEYIRWREAVLKRDGWLCRRCPSRDQLHAHHIKPWAVYPELRYVVANGLTLCKDCHKFEHRSKKMSDPEEKSWHQEQYEKGLLSTTSGRPPKEMASPAPDPEIIQEGSGKGQHKDYWVLSESERKKGFVRPVRLTYIHVGPPGPQFPLRDLTEEEKKMWEPPPYPYVKFEAFPEGFHPGSAIGQFWTQEQLDRVGKGCGGVTRMGVSLAETYAANPGFYGSTFCVHCGTHLPVGRDGEFLWDGTNERVGT